MHPESSFEEFAVATSSMLYRTAWLLTSDQHAAEDLVQETLARVFPRWGRKPIDNPAGYARTVLVRIFVKGRQRRSASEVVTDQVPQRVVEEDLSAALSLHAAIADLNPRDRAVLVLRYYGDRSVAEVASDLGMSETAVRTRASRAIARLRPHLGDEFTVSTT